MHKIAALYRRLRLGKTLKHQYNCHPDFNLQRGESACQVLWKRKAIANIPYASHLQNQFAGACFIVASGPSLAQVDLQKIARFDTISLNCAIKKFSQHQMTPTHCIAVDHRVFERQWDCIEHSILSGAQCFFSYEGLASICEHNPALLAHHKIALIESISKKFNVARLEKTAFEHAMMQDSDVLLDPPLLDYSRSIGFCGNLAKGVFSGKTVATWAVQLAYGLGYRKIFIIGMDLGGTGKSHFYADAQQHPAPDFMKDYEPHIRACFELARSASQSHQFELYNLSEHSHLPSSIIPKISLDEALALAQNTYSN